MRKNLMIISALFANSLYAASDTQIINYFKAQIPVPTIQIEVQSRTAIENIKGMDYVTIFISDGARGQKTSVFTQGDLIFPDVIDSKAGKSLKKELQAKQFKFNLKKLYKEENKENILTLGQDKSKETLVVFTDPECPFCNKELEKIDERLKTHNLKLIFTPVHERSSLEKAALILKQAKATDDIKKQVEVLKKYFNGSVDEKVSDEEVNNIQSLIQKYFSAGLQGVPYIINEKELL